MNKSESIDKLVAALAAAQKGLSSVSRNRKVRVKSKRTDTTYEFEYTTFDAIIEHVRTALTSNGLWFTQTLENGDGGKYRLVTTLMHESGQWLESVTPLMVEDGGNQAFGSALTYMKRYALAALLGIASDDDDDANEADGNTVNARSDKPQARTVAPQSKTASTPAEEFVKNQTAVIAAATLDGLKAWETKHEGNMKRLAKADPKAADEIDAAIAERRAALSNFGIAAE